MPATFVQIPIDLINYVNARKLSGLQYRLWLFLYSLDPFGDRYVPIPSPESIASELNVCARSIQRAAQRLADLDLFDFNIGNWAAKNTTINKKSPKNSTRTKGSFCQISDKDVSNSTKRSKSGQKDPTSKPEYSHSKQPDVSQTNTDKLDLSYGEQNLNRVNNPKLEDLSIDFWAENNIDNPTPIENKSLKEGSIAPKVEQNNENLTAEIINLNESSDNTNDRAIAVKNNKPNALNWLPDGPWKVEGKLDPQFREWLAKDWFNRYGGTIHQKKADVLAHFRKDPANLPIRWEQYGAEYLDRYENTAMRLSKGLSIKLEEKKQLINNQAAITRVMPKELDLVAPLPNKETKSLPLHSSDSPSTSNVVRYEGNYSDLKSKDSMLISAVDRGSQNNDRSLDLSKIPDSEQKPNNIDAYKIWKPQEIEAPASPSQIKQLLQSFKNCFKSIPSSPQPEKTNSELAKLNFWLSDEILYPEAVKRAKAVGYEIEYSPDGVAIAIKELEF